MSAFDPTAESADEGIDVESPVQPDAALPSEEAGETDFESELFSENDPLSVVTKERDEYLDSLRRLQAEFDNYRKRMTRQQSELLERATESLLERLLPTLDALDLATAHAGEATDGPSAQLAGALGQIASLLRDTLSKEGLERIDEVDVSFDPSIHDAVAHDPSDGESGVTVAEIMRSGYRLKGRVVRPAMVRVRG